MTRPKDFSDTAVLASPIEAVLFDLDGTLLDSAAAVAAVLGRALADEGLAALPVDTVRTLIGHGAAVLVQRARACLDLPPDAAAEGRLLAAYLSHYALMLSTGNLPAVPAYPGAATGLRALHARGLRLGVVTNSPRAIATTLLQRAGLSAWVEVVIGGDGGLPRKPAPDPLWFACDSLGVSTGKALMVGDSAVDIQSARAAGLPVVCVTYGYTEGADPAALPCDAFVDSLAYLPALIDAQFAHAAAIG